MSTRELRSDAKRKREADIAPAVSKPAPLPKRQKTGLPRYIPTRYECYTCGENKTERQFPEFNPSADCEHSIHTCKACLRAWVDISIENNQTAVDSETFGIPCPECPSIMRAVNIQIATIKKMYEQFEKLERKHIADATPGWRWCLSPYCNAGQVHKTAAVVPKAKEKEEEGSTYDTAIYLETYEYVSEVIELPGDPNICTCKECGARACVVCDRPEHVGETCKAYQLRIKDRVEEEDAAIRAIQRNSKPCPNCNVRIQKNGGCAHMYCSKCKFAFTWTEI